VRASRGSVRATRDASALCARAGSAAWQPHASNEELHGLLQLGAYGSRTECEVLPGCLPCGSARARAEALACQIVASLLAHTARAPRVGAVLLRARRSERTPRPHGRPACALLQQGTLLPRKRHSHSPLAPPRVPVTPAFPKERRKQKVPFGMVVRGRQAAGGDEGRVLCVLVTCRTAEGVENTLLSRYFDGCDAAAQVCMCACT
jgi:hypothetical protein